MLRLRSLTIKGLPSAETVELAAFGGLTVVVGPNGAGKTTVLRAAHEAINALSRCMAECDAVKDPWLRFRSASLTLVGDASDLEVLKERFPQAAAPEITFAIEHDAERAFVAAITCAGETWRFPEAGSRRLPSASRNAAADEVKAALRALEKHNAANPPIFGRNTGDATKVKAHAKKKAELKTRHEEAQKKESFEASALMNFFFAQTQRHIHVSDFEEWLRRLRPPHSVFVNCDGVARVDKEVAAFGAWIADGRAGAEPGGANEALQQLTALTEMSALAFVRGNEKPLHVNENSWTVASRGTQICVRASAGFAQWPEGAVVIWDEPENGLHATRRALLAQRLRKDARRQYLIGTHATELCPLSASDVEVYEARAAPPEGTRKVPAISLGRVSERRDAFPVAERLGLRPSEVLFTANVVVWVEGPSDMLFWRWAIGAHPRGRDLVAGFHYTFLMFGGENLRHARVSDDGVGELFDLLSVSRNPVVIVDSDLTQPPADEAAARSALKAHVQRMFRAMDDLNARRAGAGLTLRTAGREVENYLPWKAHAHAMTSRCTGFTDQELERIKNAGTEVDRYAVSQDDLTRLVAALGITLDEHGHARRNTRARWSEDEKVEWLRSALECPALAAEHLLHNGAADVERVCNFIRGHQRHII